MSTLDKVSKYEVLEKIAESSFAVVYKGRDPFTRRLVAIKIAIAQDEALRERFLAAAEKAASLQHPSIARIYEFGSGDGKPYLVEEFLSGSDFRSLIPSGAREAKRKLSLLLQVATALAFAHRRGVLHRDLKPATVHVEANDRIKVVDFGLSRLGSANAWLAGEDRMIGGQGYLPPELALGLEADARTDIYCFGALTYELLSARRPFAAQSYPELVRQTLEGKPVPLVARWRDCPPALSDLTDRCLERDPGARPSTFADLIDELVPIVERLSGEDTRGAKVLSMTGRAPLPLEEDPLDDTQEIPAQEIPDQELPDQELPDQAIPVQATGSNAVDPEETEDYLATHVVEPPSTAAAMLAPETQFMPELAVRDALAPSTRALALAPLPDRDDEGDSTHPDLTLDEQADLRESPTRPGLVAPSTAIELGTLPGLAPVELTTKTITRTTPEPLASAPPPIPAGTLPAMEPVTRTLLELERRAQAQPAAAGAALPPPAVPLPVPPQSAPAAKPVRPATKRRWLPILLVVFGLLSLLAAGFVGLVWYMRNQPSATPVSRRTVTPATTASAASATAARGRLVINAAPWGEIRQLVDEHGKLVPLPAGSTTPLSLEVPPGRYTATLARPGSTSTVTCETVVASGGASLCQAELETLKPLEYFKEAGWWR